MNRNLSLLFKSLLFNCLSLLYCNTNAQELNFNYLIERGIEAVIQCGEGCKINASNYDVNKNKDSKTDLTKSLKFTYEITSSIIQPANIKHLGIAPDEVDTLIISDWYINHIPLNLFGNVPLTYLEAVNKEREFRAQLESEGHLHFLVHAVIFIHSNYVDVTFLKYCDGFFGQSIVIRFKKIIPSGYLPEVLIELIGYSDKGFIKNHRYISGCVPMHWVKSSLDKD